MGSLLPTKGEYQVLNEISEKFIKTGFLPVSIKTPQQALLIAMKGRELGIPPLQALSQIHVIQGKPTISAELMLALIYRNFPEAIITFKKTDNEACIIEAKRTKDQEKQTFTFTIKDAEQAGLLSKDTWRKYPAALLRARNISAMARALFPDAIMGASYTPEELGAEVEESEDGFTVKDEAQTIDTPAIETIEPTEDQLSLYRETLTKLMNSKQYDNKKFWEFFSNYSEVSEFSVKDLKNAIQMLETKPDKKTEPVKQTREDKIKKIRKYQETKSDIILQHVKKLNMKALPSFTDEEIDSLIKDLEGSK